MPTIAFKVTQEEARRLRANAKRLQLSVSEFVRRKVSVDGVVKKRPLFTRCAHTGVKIFAGSPEMIPLNTDTMRAMLADFP